MGQNFNPKVIPYRAVMDNLWVYDILIMNTLDKSDRPRTWLYVLRLFICLGPAARPCLVGGAILGEDLGEVGGELKCR